MKGRTGSQSSSSFFSSNELVLLATSGFECLFSIAELRGRRQSPRAGSTSIALSANGKGEYKVVARRMATTLSRKSVRIEAGPYVVKKA